MTLWLNVRQWPDPPGAHYEPQDRHGRQRAFAGGIPPLGNAARPPACLSGGQTRLQGGKPLLVKEKGKKGVSKKFDTSGRIFKIYKFAQNIKTMTCKHIHPSLSAR